MNKTREQWARIDPKFCAENNSIAATTFLLADAKDDIEALFRQRDMLLAALEGIRSITNADDPESYRCDDREGCLDTVFGTADAAIAAVKGDAV